VRAAQPCAAVRGGSDSTSSPVRCVALRLEPGEEIKARLSEIAAGRSVFVVSCVGSVTSVGLRLAGYTASDADNATKTTNKLRFYDAHFEIVSLSGSICADGLHLHMSMADCEGRVVGGHLMYATVFTTAEILLAVLPDGTLARTHDARTGFPELAVAHRPGVPSHIIAAQAATASWRAKVGGSLASAPPSLHFPPHASPCILRAAACVMVMVGCRQRGVEEEEEQKVVVVVVVVVVVDLLILTKFCVRATHATLTASSRTRSSASPRGRGSCCCAWCAWLSPPSRCTWLARRCACAGAHTTRPRTRRPRTQGEACFGAVM